jgi:hypothetical protein
MVYALWCTLYGVRFMVNDYERFILIGWAVENKLMDHQLLTFSLLFA